MDDLHRKRIRIKTSIPEKEISIVTCCHGRISPYWFGLWAKTALLTGRQNMSQGQYFTHLACSLHHCERVFFWAVYNNTCALYFPQINGNARGATQDGCHRQLNLSTAEQRYIGRDQDDRSIHWDNLRLVVFSVALLVVLVGLNQGKSNIEHLLLEMYLLFIHPSEIQGVFCISIKYITVWLVGKGKREEKSSNWLPGDHFLNRVQEADWRAGQPT